MLLRNFVIGSTVEAAYYALVNEHFFISTRKMPPLFFRKLDVTILGKKTEPEAWTQINVMLGLLSKRLVFEDTTNIRVVDRTLKIICGNTTFKYEFDNLFVFDPTSVQLENNIITPNPKTYCVIDDFELSILGPKRRSLKSKQGGSGLAKELHFYSSDRVDGSDYITDCVVESELTHEQINSFDYSDSIVRFIVERHLAEIGVFGSLMKYYENGKPKYRKPKVVHVKRLTYEKDNNVYEDSDKIKFLNLKLREIIEKSTKR